MKLNNKGMSIIEIVVTFALIMVLVLQMLTIVMNYREKANFSLKKLDLDTFKNNITRDLQKDIMTLGVEEMNTEGECESIPGLNQCINIVFKDGSEKVFGTSKVDSNNYDSIENKYLYYDGLKYELRDSLPDTIPVGRNVLDFQNIEIVDNSILSTSSAILDDGTVISIYSIDVYISHVDFEDDFGVHVVATTDEINS